MKKRNYGLKFDERKPEDYIFGANLPMEGVNPSGDWTDYLPSKEFQNLNNIEPYACVAFTILNCVEAIILKLYKEERNYSDRFLAVVSGTKEGGNSPQVVCEFLRKIGVVEQRLWPFDETIDSFEKFYEPLPPKLYELANDFKKEFEFKHEYVFSDDNHIREALKCSPLLISVPAWYLRDGKYYRPDGVTDNHATTLFVQREGEYRRVFDSYENPHIKDLEWEVMPTMIKRFLIKKRDIPEIANTKHNWLIDILYRLYKFFFTPL